MLLAVNANNTNTVFAVWDGARLAGAWRAATDARRTADEYVVWLDHLLALKGLSRQEIEGAICQRRSGGEFQFAPAVPRVLPQRAARRR